jgi:hypothetical protein
MLLGAVTVKSTVVDLGLTVTLCGKSTFGSVLLSAITADAPAGAESVTVQIEVSFDPRVVGLHCNDVITVNADSARSMLLELLL